MTVSGRVKDQSRRCHATNRQRLQCGNPAIPGGRVCRIHGGSLQRTKSAAQRRLAEQKALRSLAEKGVAPLGDPLEAFRDLAAEALAVKEWAASHVAELREQLTKTDKTGREDVKALLSLYERAMDRAARVLGEYVRLGIEDRLAALDERRAAVVERVIVAVLREVGIGMDDRVRAIVHRELVSAQPRVIEAEL